MITLPPDIDRDMLPRSTHDAAGELGALDAVLAEVEKPGWFQGDDRILAVAMVTDDAGLEFMGRALSSTLPAGDEDDATMLRGVARVLAQNLVMEFEVELMLKLVGPDSAVERIGSPLDGLSLAPHEAFTAAHRRISGPQAAVAVMSEKTATALCWRWGLAAHHFPDATLAAMLNAGLVVTGTTEVSGQPLWGQRILLARNLPVATRCRWNGEIHGATVDRGWWTTVRRRVDNGRKVVTVGRYETPLELCGLDAAIIVDVKGALS